MAKYKCRLDVIFAEEGIKRKGEFAQSIGMNKSNFSRVFNSHSIPDFENTYNIIEELFKRTGKEYRLSEVWVKRV